MSKEFSALVDALEANNRLEDEDAVPELPNVAVGRKAGDLWEAGNHLLFCGDATADEAYQALLDGDLADMSNSPIRLTTLLHTGRRSRQMAACVTRRLPMTIWAAASPR